jgi:Peptidoglycan-binding protein, CsiV
MTYYNRTNCLAWLALPVLLLLLAVPAARAETGLYDVEVIIFSNGSARTDDELMDRPGTDTAPARVPFTASAFTELSADAYRMNGIRSALAGSGRYRVLFHRVWRQAAYDRGHAVGYPVHTSAASGRDSLTGTITLLKERYLHLDVDLLLTTGGNAPAAYQSGTGSLPVYRLAEKRRIRSNELHYFDHPRFGVIARVTPYQEAEEQAAPGSVEQPVPDDAGAGGVEPEAAPDDDQLTR